MAWGRGLLVSEVGFQGRPPSRGSQKQDLGWGVPLEAHSTPGETLGTSARTILLCEVQHTCEAPTPHGALQ